MPYWKYQIESSLLGEVHPETKLVAVPQMCICMTSLAEIILTGQGEYHIVDGGPWIGAVVFQHEGCPVSKASEVLFQTILSVCLTPITDVVKATKAPSVKHEPMATASSAASDNMGAAV